MGVSVRARGGDRARARMAKTERGGMKIGEAP